MFMLLLCYIVVFDNVYIVVNFSILTVSPSRSTIRHDGYVDFARNGQVLMRGFRTGLDERLLRAFRQRREKRVQSRLRRIGETDQSLEIQSQRKLAVEGDFLVHRLPAPEIGHSLRRRPQQRNLRVSSPSFRQSGLRIRAHLRRSI